MNPVLSMPVLPKITLMNIKKPVCFAVLASFLMLLTAYDCERPECNYITDYYQLVYDAQLEYLKGNYDSAYILLKKAASDCELLNQPETRETIIYAELCARKGLDDEAFYYLEEVLKNGFQFKFLEYNEALTRLHKHPKWQELKEKATQYKQEYENTINTKLKTEIIAMNKADQEIRSSSDYEKMKIVDSTHENRMKTIFKTYGYPDEKLIGASTPSQRTDITIMLMHFKDTTYFKPILYEFIKKGECPPNVLGAMIDSQDRGSGIYTYGIYPSVDSTEIKDFENLDKRRTAIGLRPWKKHKETMKLIVEKYSEN